MGVTQAVAMLAVLVAVVIALPQQQLFGHVHSSQQQPGNLYHVPDSHHNHGLRQLAPVVPVGPVSVPLQPSKPVKMLPVEHGLEGSVMKPAEVIMPDDARNPDFSALLNKLTGSTVTHTSTSTIYYATSTVTITSTVV